jgi:Flp pilus assembly protein TadG
MHHTTTQHSGQPRRRAAGDGGAALVELAFVMSLLFLLVFGIITFGLILSFKQDVTRAAAEGARAGAVAYPATDVDPGDLARDAAWDATVEAVEGFDRQCGADSGVPGPDGMTCTVDPIPCPEDTDLTCVRVNLVYAYADYPLIARLPLVSGFLPDTISATSVVRTN